MHRTLERQLRRCGIQPDSLPTDPEGWARFLERLSNAYQEHDQERYLLKRSLEMSSTEMEALYEKLREETASQVGAERDRLRSVISSLGAGLCVLDEDGAISAINPEATRILDWTEEEVVGQDLSDWFVEETGTGLVDQIATGSNLRSLYARLRKPSGETVPVSFVLSPILDGGSAINAVLVFTDMTEIRAAEEAMAKARDEAVELARVKAEFLANMSHEIRTPMNGVIGMMDLLLDTKLDTEQLEFAKTVQSCSHSLLTILNDILDLSKIEAGKMPIEIGPTDLRQVIRETANLLSASARSKGIALSCQPSADIPSLVTTDGVRIRQILTNLTGNAIKFTEHGEVALDASVTARSNDAVTVRFEVRDTGIGIATDRLGKIFDSFTQADGSMTRKFGGTGLGLTISRQLVELLSGQIGVESELGQGSTFWFSLELPVAESVSQQPAEPTVEGEDRQLNILLVEDNAINAKFATYMLKKCGHAFDLAQDGEVAIEKLKAQEFDLVLMDIQMPVVDGYEATQRWRAHEVDSGAARRMPIIAMTANAMDGDEERCLAGGMDDYISKPIDVEQMRAMLQRWAQSIPIPS